MATNLPSGIQEAGKASTGSSCARKQNFFVFRHPRSPLACIIMHDLACGSVSLYITNLTVDIWKLGERYPIPHPDFQRWSEMGSSRMIFLWEREFCAGDLVQIIFRDTAGFSGSCVSLPADTVLLSSLFPSCLYSIPSGYYVQAVACHEESSINLLSGMNF